MTLSAERQRLKDVFFTELGCSAFDDSWSRLLKYSPQMFATSLQLASVPKKNRHLPPKIQSLISLAVSAASTHLYLPHIRRHTHAALANGATPAEIAETLSLTATLGIHACTTGIPLLFEVLEEQGKAPPKGMQGMNKGQWALREDFESKRGYWNQMWEEFIRISPDFFEAYTEFSSVPWTSEGGKGVLEPKVCSGCERTIR